MRTVAVLFTICLLFSCKTQKEVFYESDRGVHFYKSDNLASILDQAKSEDKFVFVDFYTDWCGPCKMMDQEVFSDEEFGEFFNTQFISYKVNAEKANGPDLAQLYEVKGFPTFIFLDHKGRVLHQELGMVSKSKLMEVAQILNN